MLNLLYYIIYISTMVGLLYWVGLRTNVANTVGIVCRPYQSEGTQSEAACERRMTGAGPSYREIQRVRL